MRRNNVLIAHAFFDVLGGAEALALMAAKALKESGFDVTIATSTPLNTRRIKELFGVDTGYFRVLTVNVRPSGYVRFLPRGKFSILRRLATYKSFFEGFLSRVNADYDLVMETQSNMPSPADISYIHLPYLTVLTNSLQRRGRIYYWLIKHYANSICRQARSGRVLTNSTWTAAQVFRAYGVVAQVIYPPVDVEYFSKALSNECREKTVVTVCRFTREKRVERVIDAAARLRDYTFIIMGSAGEESMSVVRSVKERVEELGLSNVDIRVNASRKEVLECFKYAKYYLHPEYAEYFGMSIVEAMAAGLVPIVFRGGGAWYDVVSKVSDLLGYRRIEEVPRIVRRIDGERGLYERLRERSASVSRLFSYSNFKGSLLKEVNHVLRIKALALEA